MTPEDYIKLAEGYRNLPYDDATGKPLKPGDALKGALTIGWGTNLSAGISIKAAQFLFDERLKEAEKDASTVIGYGHFYGASERQRAALIEMAYQLGRTRLAKFERMIEAVKKGDWFTAQQEARDSKWAKDFPDRAKRVTAWFTEDYE